MIILIYICSGPSLCVRWNYRTVTGL